MRRSFTPVISAVNVTVIPRGAAARWATLTCVPTVSWPASKNGSTVSLQVCSIQPIMCGVESTRGPSCPRKVMATSVVTSSFFSPLAPTGIVGMSRGLRRRQPGQNAAHIAEGPLHAGQRVLGVDLIFQVDAALVIHFLELLENGREWQVAVAHIALACLFGEVAQILYVHVKEARAGVRNR